MRKGGSKPASVAPTGSIHGEGDTSLTTFDAELCSILLPDTELGIIPFSPPAPDADTRFIVMQAMTTSSAFWAIGRMLELQCSQENGFNIGAEISSLPPTLHPTARQQTQPHKPYIDMMPWAALRDRVLANVTVINEMEFINDMLSESLKIWGTVPWDPMSWEFDGQVLRKWWFLMDQDIVLSTNFWRAQRGEQGLILGEISG